MHTHRRVVRVYPRAALARPSFLLAFVSSSIRPPLPTRPFHVPAQEGFGRFCNTKYTTKVGDMDNMCVLMTAHFWPVCMCVRACVRACVSRLLKAEPTSHCGCTNTDHR